MFDKTDVNYIIYLLNRTKQDNTDDFQIWNGSANYILNQLLRQIKTPKENWYITYKADTLWQQLTTDKIDDYYYKKKVTLSRNEHLSVTTFKGNSKNPNVRPISKGDSFAFREVFHDEHIIPIKIIINQLLKLDKPTYETVVEVLSKISICRMLKTEDRSIYNSHKRSFDLSTIIETTYLKSGIYMKDYPYKHMVKMTKDDLSYVGGIELAIPKDMIVEFFPHPEPYGYKIALLPNGMYTDVYKDGNGDYYSKTNDLELIKYVMFLQEVFAKFR
ncbi:MAG: hypothetical protein Q8M70_07515 [bacterium]|nr:hypothetical protein [bacterium]